MGNEKETEEEFTPRGAIAFFIVLMILFMGLYFAMYFLMLGRG